MNNIPQPTGDYKPKPPDEQKQAAYLARARKTVQRARAQQSAAPADLARVVSLWPAWARSVPEPPAEEKAEVVAAPPAPRLALPAGALAMVRKEDLFGPEPEPELEEQTDDGIMELQGNSDGSAGVIVAFRLEDASALATTVTGWRVISSRTPEQALTEHGALVEAWLPLVKDVTSPVVVVPPDDPTANKASYHLVNAWIKEATTLGITDLRLCITIGPPAEWVNSRKPEMVERFIGEAGPAKLPAHPPAGKVTKAPQPSGDQEHYDAILAERASKEALEDYLWVPHAGEHHWTGCKWERCTDEEVVETIRRWVIDMWQEAIDDLRNCDPQDIGARNHCIATVGQWARYLNRTRIEALAKLSQGIRVAHIQTFDAHPDLLNVGNGVVNLRTGELLPHDKDLRLTKITDVYYVPGAKHKDWDAALMALPADEHEWVQVRWGQGITGHMTPDDVLVVQQGSGENGKTTLMLAIRKALGEHYTTISHRALLADPSQHPTELMSFRGARMAVIEETPEEGRLSVARLKAVAGTSPMKARYVKQDEVEWEATHSLFLNTNYTLRVDETDHGTWRRLLLLKFPYTFRKPGETLVSETDRTGDPTLRERLRAGKGGRAEAVLAWLVEGAVKWYRAGRVMPAAPQRVVDNTLEWRIDADLVLGYIKDRLEFDPQGHIINAVLREDFNDWVTARGQRVWSERTFKQRFGDHAELQQHGVKLVLMRRQVGLSFPPDSKYLAAAHQEGVYRGWQGVRFRTAADAKASGDAKVIPFLPIEHRYDEHQYDIEF